MELNKSQAIWQSDINAILIVSKVETIMKQ